MDINQEIQSATDKFIEQRLPAMVEEKVSKMVDGILDDIFRSYSDTAKQIKSKIESKLDINLQKFDIVDYNALVSKAINDHLVGIVNENAVAPILSLVKETVGYIDRKTIKISEIHEMVLKAAEEENSGISSEGEISFHVEEDEAKGWHRIAFDLDKGKSIRDCEIEFLVSKRNNGSIFCFKAGNFMQRKAAITPARVTMLSKLEHQIFRLYSAGASIEIDEYDFSNTWSAYEY